MDNLLRQVSALVVRSTENAAASTNGSFDGPHRSDVFLAEGRQWAVRKVTQIGPRRHIHSVLLKFATREVYVTGEMTHS